MKRCYKCKKHKLVLEFSKDKTKKNGLSYLCKRCHQQYDIAHKKERQKRDIARTEERLLWQRRYQLAHKEKIRQYQQKNSVTRKEKAKQYYRDHKEEIGKRQKQYYKDHKEEFIKYSQDHQEERKQYYKQYGTTQKGKMVAKNNNHRRRTIYQITDITTEWLIRLFNEAIYCPLCKVKMIDNGRLPNGKTLDHIFLLSLGGTHTMENVRITCFRCNLKRPKDGSDYIQKK